MARPKFHAIAHGARRRKQRRPTGAISLARLVDFAACLLVHMSEIEAIETLRQAQKKGLKIFGETCPQYNRASTRPTTWTSRACRAPCGAAPPPPRDSCRAGSGVGGAEGRARSRPSRPTMRRTSSNEGGKIPKGDKTTFKEMANGVPGIELRLAAAVSARGVQKGRITLQQFVQLGSTNHARLYGLYPRKGVIAVGSDGRPRDLGCRQGTSRSNWTDLHDNVGYTPYEGRQIKGWPGHRGEPRPASWSTTASSTPREGSGKFLPCASPDSSKPLGKRPRPK